MKVIFKISRILLFFSFFATGHIYALSRASTCKNDTVQTVVRLPLKASIDKLANDPEFQYRKDVAPATDWWGKFWQWIYKQLGKLFKGLDYDNFWQYVFMAIIALTAAFVILKLLGVNTSSLFTRKNAQLDIPYETVQEDVRKMNFDELIGQALENKNYRLAVRLFYLKTLKELNEKEVISWKPEKTNRNYLNELSAHHLKEGFQQMTHQFEYVWYGEFDLKEAEFLLIRDSFLSFQQTLNRA